MTGPGLRIGQGFDVHPFSTDPTRPLILGGVTVAPTGGLDGHSDADAVAHALADALLGAAGLGDLGGRFPATDPAWAGADSIGLLAAVATLVADAGWVTVNADCTVICEQPALSGHTDAMAARLGATVDAPVSVRAKRAEGLGAVGRGEGVACLAAALLAVR